ncbi:MAG: hypothetical protein U5L45_03315 [Saprospiraceae bacterium]|nr:hypothetical protein [Saprospiraceae bacterium]
MRSLRSRKGRRWGSFFGLCPKNEPHSPFSRERSEREQQQFRFYVWFQRFQTDFTETKPMHRFFFAFFVIQQESALI